jgi:hypothetical protein
MLNLKDIFTSWIRLTTSTEQQSKLAEIRFDVCKGCVYKQEIIKGKEWSLLCGKCGCPIKAKVFSDAINPCPMGYWKEIDKNFGVNVDEKNKKSIL